MADVGSKPPSGAAPAAPPTGTEAERRTSARVPIDIWVEQMNIQDSMELYIQRAANLSVGGIFLDNSVPHPEGTKVRLFFTLPGDDERLEVRGEVVAALDGRHHGLAMAVRFLDLEPATEQRIGAFVDGVLARGAGVGSSETR
jgi:uncharacterized protein (TIGR02266 family)